MRDLRAARRRRRGARRPRALGDPGPRRLPHARVLRGRPRRGVRAARRRRELRGAPRARAAASSRRSARRATAGEEGLARRARPSTSRLDAPRRDDDVRGEVGLRARPRDGARPAPRRPRRGRDPDLARRARGPARVRRRGRRRVRRLPARGGAAGGGRRSRRRPTSSSSAARSTRTQARRYLDGVPRRRARAAAARRPVHGVGRDPARDRARRALGRPSRGDRATRDRRARRERRRRRPAARERALPRTGRCRRLARSSTPAPPSPSRPTSTPGSAFCESLPLVCSLAVHAAPALARGGARRVHGERGARARRAPTGRGGSRRASTPTSSCSPPTTGATSRTTSAAPSSTPSSQAGEIAWSSAGIIASMPTRKQRRRRAKEQRHEYVWEDAEGNELDARRGADAEKAGVAGGSGLAPRREPQAPSWQRTLKRGRDLRADHVRHGDAALERPVAGDARSRRRRSSSRSSSRSATSSTASSGARTSSARRARAVRRPARELTRAPMPLRVEQLSLGPIGTNCYVVRADATADEAVVVDPSGDATELRLAARAAGHALRRDPRHARALGPPASASPTSPRARARRCTWPRASGCCSRARGVHAAGASRCARTRPTCCSRAASRSSVAGHRRSTCSPVPGHSPAHLAYHADGSLFSGDVLFAGSVGRTDLPGADWETLVASIRSLVDTLPAGDGRLPRSRARDDARRRARAEPVPRRAARGAHRVSRAPKIERPRGTHDVLPPSSRSGAASRREAERLCAPVRLPADRDPGVRGHGALRADVRRRLGRRAEGDVHVRGPVRPLADAASRGDRADLPRVRRARHAPRAAAGEALHDRADVPLSAPQQGPLPRALAALRRGDRHRRPVDRRRGDPALRRAARAARRHASSTSRSTRSAAASAGRRTSSACARGSRRTLDRLDEADAREGRDEPAARVRQLSRRSRRPSGRRSTRRRRSATRSARRAASTSPPSGAISTRTASRTSSCRRSSAGSTTTRARPGSSSARSRNAERRSRAAAATTGSSRRSAGRRRRASASARASSG